MLDFASDVDAQNFASGSRHGLDELTEGPTTGRDDPGNRGGGFSRLYSNYVLFVLTLATSTFMGAIFYGWTPVELAQLGWSRLMVQVWAP